jgi:hypothetical protein
MKIFLFALLCGSLLMVSQHLYAQTDFRPATILLKDGSRLEGEVDYPYWDEGTNRVLFRKAEGVDRRFISTVDIQQLTLPEEPEERFYGVVTERLDYSSMPDQRPTSDSLVYVQDTLLLQAVLLGTVSFYYYEAEDGTPHYFIERNGKLEELIQHEYYRVGQDRRIRKRHEQYREQLAAVLNDCSKMTTKRLEDFVLDDDNLLRLIKQYNNCGEGQSIGYSLLPLKPSWSVRPTVGIAFTRVSEKTQQLNALNSGAWLPRLGISTLLHLPQSNGRSGFLFEALYAPFETTDNIDNITVDVDYVQLNLGLRKSGNSPIYGSAYTGLIYAMQIGDPTISGLPDNVFFSNQLGVFGGFGVGGDRFEVSLRYEMNNIGLILGSAPNYFSNSLLLMAHYRLF